MPNLNDGNQRGKRGFCFDHTTCHLFVKKAIRIRVAFLFSENKIKNVLTIKKKFYICQTNTNKKDMKNNNIILEIIDGFNYLSLIRSRNVECDGVKHFEAEFVENKIVHSFSMSWN